MIDRHFTLVVVSEDREGVRNLQVSRKQIHMVISAALVVFALVVVFVMHYGFAFKTSRLAKRHAVENHVLRTEMQAISTQVDSVDKALFGIRQFDQKLRRMTHLNDDGRALQLVLQASSNPDHVALRDTEVDPGLSLLDEAALNARSPRFREVVVDELETLRSLLAELRRERSLLVGQPTHPPVKGWVTSLFGVRDDSVSGDTEMHTGVDIAAPFGAHVRAAESGIVLFAGELGRYGKTVVIDHGSGMTTHYAHLSDILVESGQSVDVTNSIGLVGNTGLSSGPHLHYEVRKLGMAIDPMPYLEM